MNSGQRRGGIFISYRREDAALYARVLKDRLSEHFPAALVFMDADSIGVDFTVITQAVSRCDILLVLIGREWLTMTDSRGQRRIDDPGDFVRIEIEAALQRGIRVVPVLVDGAVMPQAADLPLSLRPLVRRNALMLSPAGFRSEVSRLIAAVDAVVGAAPGRAVQAARDTDRAAAETGPPAGEPPAGVPVKREAEQQAREQAKRKSRQEADRQARQEADRQARDEAEQQARRKAEPKEGGKPSGRPGGKPSGRPANKPSGRPGGKPSGRPANKPSGRPGGKSSGRPARRQGRLAYHL
jgi:TIR domain